MVNETRTIQSVGRTMALLETTSAANGELRLTELSAKMGLERLTKPISAKQTALMLVKLT